MSYFPGSAFMPWGQFVSNPAELTSLCMGLCMRACVREGVCLRPPDV